MSNASQYVISKPYLGYRPDIDGLRAFAIVVVVIFHAFPRMMPGGFVGVDIFFVISGFLITGIILKGQADGRFSLIDFYIRRINRIFPALIVILIGCLLAGWGVLLADEYKALGQHVAVGSIYGSNFLLMKESGYFDIAAELKPLLHLWSLGIEEQFYLLWPLILVLAFRTNLNPFTVIALLAIASFSLNISLLSGTAQQPVRAFYFPSSRAWELLVGAVLAYVNLYKKAQFDLVLSRLLLRDPKQSGADLPNILSWIGIILLTLAIFGLNKGMLYPGWWALFPTIGTACLIVAGEQSWISRKLLINKVAVGVGLISFPLYLWHWPLLAFARIVEGQALGVQTRVTIVFLSVVMAFTTYWLLEKRIRSKRHWGYSTTLLVVLLLIGLMGFQINRQGGYKDRFPDKERLARNVGALSWENAGWNQQSGCMAKFGKEFHQYCQIYNIEKPPTVLLVGDSNANHFYPGLAKEFAKTDDNLLNLGKGSCMPFYGAIYARDPLQGDPQCELTIDKALNFGLDTPSVKTIVLAMVGHLSGEKAPKLVSLRNPKLTGSIAILEDSMRSTLKKLTTSGKQIVFIVAIPQMLDFNPATCVDLRPWRVSAPTLKVPCAVPQKEFEAAFEGYRTMVFKVLKEFPQVKVWNPSKELCDGVSCHAIRAGVLLYRDPVHLSEAGSVFVGERLGFQDPLER